MVFKTFLWLFFVMAYPWWVTPMYRIIIKSFANTKLTMVLKTLLMISHCIGHIHGVLCQHKDGAYKVLWLPTLGWYSQNLLQLFFVLAYPWWVTPMNRITIKSFMNTKLAMVLKTLLMISQWIGISWWVTPMNRITIKSFVNTKLTMILKTLLMISHCIGISMVVYANTRMEHTKFCDYLRWDGIFKNYYKYSWHWHIHGGLRKCTDLS